MAFSLGFFLNRVFVVSILIIMVSFFCETGLSAAESRESERIKINVFAVVSPELEKLVGDLSAALKSDLGLETFPMQGFQIHCTLYMTQYPADAKDDVLRIVSELASEVAEFEVLANEIEITEGNWYFINFERSRNLQTLADLALKRLAPLRIASDFVPNWAKAFPRKLEYIRQYGSPNVLEEFSPHLTMLAREDGEALKRFTESHKKSGLFGIPLKGRVTAIGAGIADRNGQIKTPLVIIPLKKE